MHDDGDSSLQQLRPAAFVVLGATLACMGVVPAAFWLADVGLVPWAEELRWIQLRNDEDAARTTLDGTVTLTRSGCFGSCPVYTVTLSTAGRVEFDGVAYVCERGLHTAQVSPAAARELIADIADAGFFDVAWNQGSLVADASDSAVTVEYGGRRRSLPSIDADSNSPRLLREIARAVDGVAGSNRWLPRPERSRRVCANGAELRD